MSDVTYYATTAFDDYKIGDITSVSLGVYVAGDPTEPPTEPPETRPNEAWIVGDYSNIDYWVSGGVATLRPDATVSVNTTTGSVGATFTFSGCEVGSTFQVSAMSDDTYNIYYETESFTLSDTVINYTPPSVGVLEILILSPGHTKDYTVDLTVT